ncbi:MAG: hypothetical protein IK012_08290 [Fibrobacter sp.]|uniref:GNAT family N-acetyltransferase n=1 Tax=Fibrobacter sp. TaxID=35828 RepID=UPI0025BB899C|nr:GNAT family N-acetyltransferase [Fibrobacter sp.]MBR4785235.1 hypothetical protein [Fibrobacter sp.]
MAWVEITADEYARHFANPVACYLKADFNMLNAEKVDKVRFFAFEDKGLRVGLAVGEKCDEWRSPYSAPFGGFVCPQMQTIACLNTAVRELKELALSQKKLLRITLPPFFYDRMFYSKVVSALLQNGFKQSYANLNYAFDLADGTPYEKRLHYMGARNYKQFAGCECSFTQETSEEQRRVVYGFIQKHYEAKGYPLWMRFEDLLKTAEIVPIDFCLLRVDGVAVASTIIYKVSEKIAQMIYWGADQSALDKRPLNVIAREMFRHYQEQGFDYLDLGPAASDGIASEGLCTFKESVGCFADLKYAFEFDGTHAGMGA